MNKALLKSLNLPKAGVDPVDDYVKERGLPVLSPPQDPGAPVRPAPSVKMAIEVPDYLPEILRTMAFQQKCTIRYIILNALKRADCKIAQEDLYKDGRKPRQTNL